MMHHTKSQIIAGAIIVKQLVKKQFTHPILNIFSIFVFVGWIFNDFSSINLGNISSSSLKHDELQAQTKMLLTMKQCVRGFHIIYHPKIFDQIVN